MSQLCGVHIRQVIRSDLQYRVSFGVVIIVIASLQIRDRQTHLRTIFVIYFLNVLRIDLQDFLRHFTILDFIKSLSGKILHLCIIFFQTSRFRQNRKHFFFSRLCERRCAVIAASGEQCQSHYAGQQKSMAKMSAFQPMIAEIQTKYKDKPEKQQAELMKLQQDFGYKPTAGCLPMLLNFLVMFGVIGVVYNPLERIFHISAAALASAGEALTTLGIAFNPITRDTNIIAEVVAGNSAVLGCFSAEQITTITEFSQHMNFLGIDLTRIPQIGLSLDIVLPLLSVLTMFWSTHVSMKASGQQMQGSMKLTMYMMPLMYLFFCFTYPLAFSLYYVISNIVMTAQTQVMRKFYDPEKMRKEVEAEIAAKRKQEKRGVKNTTITVTDPKTGKSVEKNLSASEMNKRRLEYARQLDAERYKDERTVPLSELDKQDKQ